MKRVLLFLSTVLVLGNAYTQELDFTRWQIALDGGWSYRTGEVISTIPEMISYREELRYGYNISGKGVYYFKKFIGTGVNVPVSNYHNEVDDITCAFEQ